MGSPMQLQISTPATSSGVNGGQPSEVASGQEEASSPVCQPVTVSAGFEITSISGR